MSLRGLKRRSNLNIRVKYWELSRHGGRARNDRVKGFNAFVLIKRFDIGSKAVILITLVLFILALFTKGLTHDILLEAGVFLVSAKLIFLSYQHSVASEKIQNELEKIHNLLRQKTPGDRA